MCRLVPKITLYTTWDTWDVHVYTTWDVQNQFVQDIAVHNHIVQNVHDMGCTQSHCTANNNLSTWKHAPILEQIDGTRFAENISQALMVMHWKLDLGRLLFFLTHLKMFACLTYILSKEIYMYTCFSLSIRANVYNIHIIFYQIFTCTHMFEIDVRCPTYCKIMYIR